MIRPSVILAPIARDLFREASTYGAAAAIVAVAGFLSMKVEDRIAARLEARAASIEVEKREEDDPWDDTHPPFECGDPACISCGPVTQPGLVPLYGDE